MTFTLPPPSPQILLSSSGKGWNGLEADFLHIPPGLLRVPGSDIHGLGIHFGPPVKAQCHCGDQRMRRVQMSGDIDIVPAGMDGSWEDEADCRILRLGITPALLNQVAGELGRDGARIELLPKFQLRDPRIEAIGWAIKAELEADTPSDPLYTDLLASALAVRLIETFNASSLTVDNRTQPKLSARQKRILTEFIESNLDQKLHLADLASVCAISVTRLKTLFRNSTGVPVHQYVIRRRVEYARTLLTTTAMSASEIALAAGFTHQSHMASTMRRILGQTPRDIARQSIDMRPFLR
ncbi:Exoenzyme S synthesis regulatory protein ExsA [compost metagenome]